MIIFETPPAGTEVFAVFTEDKYKVYKSTYRGLLATFISHQDMCDWVAENYLVLHSVTGLDEEEDIDYKQKYEELLAKFEQYKKESIKWSVEDFLEYKGKYTITPENAQLALEAMIHNHDAGNGINWGDVEFWLEEYGEPIENFDSPNK